MQAAMATGMAPQTRHTLLQWRVAPSEYTRVMPALTVSAPLAPNHPLKEEEDKIGLPDQSCAKGRPRKIGGSAISQEFFHIRGPRAPERPNANAAADKGVFLPLFGLASGMIFIFLDFAPMHILSLPPPLSPRFFALRKSSPT